MSKYTLAINTLLIVTQEKINFIPAGKFYSTREWPIQGPVAPAVEGPSPECTAHPISLME